MVAETAEVIIGVDTHRDEHALAVVSADTGQVIGELAVRAERRGYAEALGAVRRLAPGARVWAIEGAGAYGAGLRRHLVDAGERVVGIDRVGRAERPGRGKSDALDAVRAARACLARTHQASPRADGEREALRVLMVARSSAVEARARAITQIKSLVVLAPDQVREPLRGLSRAALVRRCAAMRPARHHDPALAATAAALRSLARLALAATAEAAAHERAIAQALERIAPGLGAEPGVGPITGAQLVISWSHRGRLRSEAAFARLGGVAPIPACSGRVVRHRLDRGGDRQLNRALHTIALTRRRLDPLTRAYIARRVAEGKSTREAVRCLKRYLARHLFRLLEALPEAA
jgi:hypothetical protein